MKKIGIDIDGCLTDVYSWYLKNGTKYAESIGKHLINKNGYDAGEMFNLSQSEFKDFIDKYLIDYSKNEPVRENASYVCNKLIEEGFELYIITARFNSQNDDERGLKMREIVEQWLKDNDIPYNHIIYSSQNKLNICLENNIDIMIEDKPSNLIEIKKHIPVICFDAPYNRNIDNNNLFRVSNWQEVLDVFSKNKQQFRN